MRRSYRKRISGAVRQAEERPRVQDRFNVRQDGSKFFEGKHRVLQRSFQVCLDALHARLPQSAEVGSPGRDEAPLDGLGHEQILDSTLQKVLLEELVHFAQRS
uniref:(northern house mosquito) hypothetical protein n=1 Tax=Culex pipiens TaxID=7175 RepID=A0A8D8AUD0_CULPI